MKLSMNLLGISYYYCLFEVICVQKLKRLFSSNFLDLTNYTNYWFLENHSDSGFKLVPPNINSVCNSDERLSNTCCEVIGFIFGPKLRIKSYNFILFVYLKYSRNPLKTKNKFKSCDENCKNWHQISRHIITNLYLCTIRTI